MQHTRTPCSDREENDKCEHSTCSALLLGSLVFYMEQDNHKYGLLFFVLFIGHCCTPKCSFPTPLWCGNPGMKAATTQLLGELPFELNWHGVSDEQAGLMKKHIVNINEVNKLIQVQQYELSQLPILLGACTPAPKN